MPRPIIPGDKRTLNKQIVETLANQAYSLEINSQPTYRVWSFRKAAWAIEGLEQDIRLVYQNLGLKGLESIPNVGTSLAKQIEQIIKNEMEIKTNAPISS